MTTAAAADIIATLPRTDGTSVTITTPPGVSTKVTIAITTPCNDRCALSGEHAEGCGDQDNCQWAPHRNTKDGGVRCGCSSCADVHASDYGCSHGVDTDCTCVEVSLHGATC